MKVLISSLIDVNRAANNRLHQFISHLSGTHSVTVVCPRDTWRGSQVDVEEYANDLLEMSSVECIYLSTSNPISPTVQEVLSEGLLRAGTGIDYSDYDIHLDYNTFFLGQAVARRTSQLGIPTVYDLADDLPAMLRESDQVPNIVAPIVERIGDSVVRRKIRKADNITYITDGLAEKMNIDSSHGVHLPNGVNTETFHPNVETSGIDIPDVEFLTGYVGVTREWVNLTQLVNVVANLRRDGVDAGLVIVGDEGGTDEAQMASKNHGIDDVCQFIGTVPYDQVPAYINTFDVGTIPFHQGAIAENSLPLKLFEYLSCGVPVVSSYISGVDDAAGDVVHFADSPTEWTHALRNLANGADIPALSTKGRQIVVDSYSWKAITEDLERLLVHAAD